MFCIHPRQLQFMHTTCQRRAAAWMARWRRYGRSGRGGGAVKERWQAGSQVLHWLPRWAKMQRCGDAGLRESVWVWEDVAASNLHRTMRWHTSSANVRPEDNREIEAARDPKDSRMQGSRAKTELPASLSQKSVKCPGWLWHGWAARRSSSRSTSLAVL